LQLEEIIQFRQFETRTAQRAHLHSANKPDEKEARNHLIDVWRSRLDGCRVDAEVHSSILAIRSLVLGERYKMIQYDFFHIPIRVYITTLID
jgi:FKBP12-rapamycin complex-associated protein